MRFKLSPNVYDLNRVISGVEIKELADIQEFDVVLDRQKSAELLLAIAPFRLMEWGNETD